ncbi:MAG TPA: peptidoglycan editing factor PgeF [Rhizomicrobium sp.]|nr:peptidoglycan editing factor PgeF [Rhizomicrobium sp.]
MLRADNLSNIAHGFFGRQGGVSTGIFAWLNCGVGSGDAREAVIENRRRAMAELGANAKLVTLHQIHSANAITVTEAWDIGQGPQADAMATNVPGIALGILTADCAPVLFADETARVIGAAHAGWKGALHGVLESALAAMEALGAQRNRIAAAIGPCISQENYEIGAEFREAFLSADSAHARFFVPSNRADHWRFDLEGLVAHRLAAAHVENVALLSACTYAREAEFYSFRRATHRGEKDYGRQLSAILLTGG